MYASSIKEPRYFFFFLPLRLLSLAHFLAIFGLFANIHLRCLSDLKGIGLTTGSRTQIEALGELHPVH